VAAFIWDGLYIGTTHIRGMLISSAIASIAFFATAIYLMPYFGNQALWLAMIVFLAMRGIVQTYLALSFELRLSR
jgi:MATE family multidrug resistance protein